MVILKYYVKKGDKIMSEDKKEKILGSIQSELNRNREKSEK